jgi:hypothetical protein
MTDTEALQTRPRVVVVGLDGESGTIIAERLRALGYLD